MPPKSKTKSPKPQASFLNTAYLLVYNALSAALWATVLAKVVLTAAGKGVASGAVYVEAERFTRLTQTVAGLEVLHSLLGSLLHLPCHFWVPFHHSLFNGIWLT